MSRKDQNTIFETDQFFVPPSFPTSGVDHSSLLMNHAGMKDLMQASKEGNLQDAANALRFILDDCSTTSTNNHHHYWSSTGRQSNQSLFSDSSKAKTNDEQIDNLTPEKFLQLLKDGYRTTESEFVVMVQILFTPDHNYRTAIYYAATNGHCGMVWMYQGLLILCGLLVAHRRTKQTILNKSTGSCEEQEKETKLCYHTFAEWLDEIDYFRGRQNHNKKELMEQVFAAWGCGGGCGDQGPDSSITVMRKCTLHGIIQAIIHPHNPFCVFLSRKQCISGKVELRSPAVALWVDKDIQGMTITLGDEENPTDWFPTTSIHRSEDYEDHTVDLDNNNTTDKDKESDDGDDDWEKVSDGFSVTSLPFSSSSSSSYSSWGVFGSIQKLSWI